MTTYERENINNETYYRKMGLYIRNGYRRLRRNPYAAAMALLLLALWLGACTKAIVVTQFNAFIIFLVATFTFLIVFFGLVLLGLPVRFLCIQNQLLRAGLTNAAGEPPIIVSFSTATYATHIVYYRFHANGISLAEFERKRIELEAALGVYIDSYEESADKQYITIRASNTGLPYKVHWHRAYLSPDSFVLTLGKGVVDLVRANFNVTPHILIGGSTGSGKSVLQKNLLMQCHQKQAEVYIIDPKSGLDYRDSYLSGCTLVTEFQDIKDLFAKLIDELARRKSLFAAAGVANLDEYNRNAVVPLSRYVVGVDELAELLTKSNDKKQREQAAEFENALSTLARLGRAFGIHLILATQRPDATVVPGQIRNNCDIRICGRCSQNLALIIHDNADAADLIKSTDQGVFLTQDGMLFKGFLPPEGGEQP